jgi:hypothetical protein
MVWNSKIKNKMPIPINEILHKKKTHQINKTPHTKIIPKQ